MGTVIRIALPLTMWLAAFSAVYGLNGWLCTTGVSAATARTLVAAAVLLAIAMQAGLIWWLRRSDWAAAGPVLRHVALTLGVVALIGTVWTLVPGLMLSRCM
ncbi:MAG: hypothetical protein ABGX10_07345 [Paracoccus sp. (in: a-proteobacteria)]|uniref:hypothetical protein n=1 Tax=Paracoccus sp. TaxID=267 RepID=UPI0032421317